MKTTTINKTIETLFGKIVIMITIKIEKSGFMITKQIRKNIYTSSIMLLTKKVFTRLLKIQTNTIIQLKPSMMTLQQKVEM